jgi:hypothetical protein
MSARYRRSLAWLLACAAPSGCIVGIADPIADGGDDGGEQPTDGAMTFDAPESSEASETSDAPQDAAGDESAVQGGDGSVDAPAESAIDAPGDLAVQDVAPLTHYVVFATSAAYTGNLGGLSGADQKCQTLASAKLTGTFKAWLSDSNTSAASHLTTHGTLPYILVDGTLVANDWTDLTSGMPQHMIDLDESGNQVATADMCSGFGGHYVWTDSNDDGTIYNTAQSCQNWTSAASTDNGSTGSASLNQATSYWSNWCNLQSCDTPASLYCVQQ